MDIPIRNVLLYPHISLVRAKSHNPQRPTNSTDKYLIKTKFKYKLYLIPNSLFHSWMKLWVLKAVNFFASKVHSTYLKTFLLKITLTKIELADGTAIFSKNCVARVYKKKIPSSSLVINLSWNCISMGFFLSIPWINIQDN